MGALQPVVRCSRSRCCPAGARRSKELGGCRRVNCDFLRNRQGYVQLRGVGRCMYAGWAAYPTTPYPLRWARPGTHPTRPASRCWRCSSPSVARYGEACVAHWLAAALAVSRRSRTTRGSTPSPRWRRTGWRRWASASRRRRSSELAMGPKMHSLVCAAGGVFPHHASASSASPPTATGTHPTPTLLRSPLPCKVPYHPLPPRASVYTHLPTPRN